MPLMAGTLLLAVAVRPAIARSPYRTLDFALIACLLVVAFQLMPLPAPLRVALSPHVGAVDRALWVGAPPDASTAPPRPLSLDIVATEDAVPLLATLLVVFWVARAALARGGVRALTRGIAWTGLALALVAIAQHATAPRLLYWLWPTIFGAPFTPFRSRNDFSTWLIMALPLTVGYIVARFQSRRRDSGHARNVVDVVDGKAVWLAGSVCLMSAGLLTAVSRSGLMGAAAALACFAWCARARIARKGRLIALACAALVIAIALTYVKTGALAERLDETLHGGIGGRQVIWRETWRMVQDFWLTGVGAGAYERGMLVYQQTRKGFYFNHAHNEYLQLATEGGLLLLAPMAIALIAAGRRIARLLGHERTPIYWIRVGAVSGLVAVAVQSVWDTGLRVPANAVLLTLLTALALHGESTSG